MSPTTDDAGEKDHMQRGRFQAVDINPQRSSWGASDRRIGHKKRGNGHFFGTQNQMISHGMIFFSGSGSENMGTS